MGLTYCLIRLSNKMQERDKKHEMIQLDVAWRSWFWNLTTSRWPQKHVAYSMCFAKAVSPISIHPLLPIWVWVLLLTLQLVIFMVVFMLLLFLLCIFTEFQIVKQAQQQTTWITTIAVIAVTKATSWTLDTHPCYRGGIVSHTSLSSSLHRGTRQEIWFSPTIKHDICAQ